MERRTAGGHRTDGHHGYYYVGDIMTVEEASMTRKSPKTKSFHTYITTSPFTTTTTLAALIHVCSIIKQINFIPTNTNMLEDFNISYSQLISCCLKKAVSF
jgi:hypothetical protein